MTQGGQIPGQPGLIHRRLAAGNDQTRRWLAGMAAPAPIRRAEGFYRELELVRIQWSKPEELGWPESTAASSKAAAGVRAPAGLALWCSGGEAGGFYVLLVRFGAWWCARL